MSQPRSQKMVLWDFDGVMVRTFRLFCLILQKQNPHVLLTTELARKLFIENVLSTQFFGTEERRRAFFKAYGPRLLEMKPIEGLTEVLSMCATLYPQHIISSGDSTIINSFLELHNLRQYFGEVLGYEAGMSKTEKLRAILTRYELNPSNAIFVTDTYRDIVEAKECGVQSIAVTWGFHEKKLLETTAPHAIVLKPDQLYAVITEYLGFPDLAISAEKWHN